ncbi:MAG: RDD family protein, partial [Planctomycetota bacterium]
FGSLGPIISWTAVAGAYFGYFLLSEASFGNTFGKWSMGLCIRSLQGQKCTARQGVIRTLLRPFEVNPIILGALPAGAAMFFSKRRQRFGDWLAGTVVVRRSS